MKRSVLISIGAVAVILAAVIIFVFTSRSNPVDDIAAELATHKGETPAVSESFAMRVPEDAVFVASTTDKENMNEWWTFFSRLDYHDPGLPLSLNEDFTPDELMFASFPVEGSGGEQKLSSAFYIRMEEKAVEFQDWLVEERSKGIEGVEEDPSLALLNSIPIIAHEDFIIIPSDSTAHHTLIEYVYDESGEEVNLDGLMAHDDWAEMSQINNSVLWADFDSYLEFYLAQGDERIKEPTMEVISSASGYQKGTTFLGTSKDGGKSWSGIFPTGGFDTEKVDLNKAEQLINESIKIGPGDITTDVSPGLMPLESVISSSTRIDEDGNIQTFGEVRPPQSSDSVVALVAVEEQFKTSVSFSPQVWSALFEGVTEYENLSHVTLDITENNSGRLSFSFYEDNQEGSES